MTSASSSRLPSPPVQDAPLPASESHHLVRERVFRSSREDVYSALRSLLESRSTGTLMVDIANGGIGSVRFREEKKVDFSAGEK